MVNISFLVGQVLPCPCRLLDCFQFAIIVIIFV